LKAKKSWSSGLALLAAVCSVAFAGRAALAHPGIRHDIDRLTGAIARDPSNGALYLERASRERIAGDLDAALADLARAEELGVADARIDLESGLVEAARGCSIEAEAALTRHLEQAAGGSAAAFLARARIRAQAGRSDDAAHDLAGAIALWPDPETYLELGSLHEDAGRLDEAAATYRSGFERLGGAVVLEAALVRVEAACGHAEIRLEKPGPPGSAGAGSQPATSLAFRGEPAITVERQPYLQLGTPASMTVAWRTDVATDSRVRYGTTAEALDHEAVVAAAVADHAVTITGLAPATKYYYDAGSTAEVHAGGTPEHFFVTSPPAGSAAPFRAWVLGDSGNGSFAQAQVRDAMLDATVGHAPDLFLHMGDIAYVSGTDAEFSAYHFAPYADILRNTVLWTTLGNHEGTSTTSGAPGISAGPYYRAFVLPSAGEAGGAPSGTEAYYSFDYANVHFVCLNSYQVDRGATAAMATWLQLDLAANTLPWIVAFWHHPPYTHGSHDSDLEIEHIEMRENLLPILEAGGVDLVLGGHSHGYERSYLLDGATMTPTPDYATLVSGGYFRDTGNGQPAGDGAYRKDPGIHPHQGAVYVVAGHGGAAVGGPMDHPIMYFSEALHGSVLMDVSGDSMTLTNVRSTGEVSDTFTLLKQPATCFDDAVCASQGPCRPGRCVNGSCRAPVLADGAACDDGDVCTSPDTCLTGTCAGPHFVSPEITNVRATADDTQLVWDAAAAPTESYDVVRGLLHDLPVGAPSEICVATSSGTPSASDPDLPSEAEGFWYLVRGRSVCEVGSWGYAGERGAIGSERTSDACP